MKKTNKKEFLLILVLSTILVISVMPAIASASAAAIYVPDDYTTIQQAVDAADAGDGDTIIVRDGTYKEEVRVDKRLTIRSENGSASTIVTTEELFVFRIKADYVNISGFTIKGATYYGSGGAGISCQSHNYCNFSYNNISNNYEGICFYNASNNVITRNNIFKSKTGIWVIYASDNNVITENNISNSDMSGINVYRYSSNNTITNNSIVNSEIGIGILVTSLANNTIIRRNNVSDVNIGICVNHECNNTTITENTISNCHREGIGDLYDSPGDVKIYLNSFIDNELNAARSDGLAVIWNSTEEITYLYDDDIYTNYLGNYWDDYEGSDADGDGIGDTPYDGIRFVEKGPGHDYHPLMVEFENYHVMGMALDSNWHQFQKDEKNTGIIYSSAPIKYPELAWSRFTYTSECGNGIDVTPIIAEDIVYVYAANGSIWAFDKTNGDLMWKNETTGGNLQTSTPAYGDGKIFVAANSGDLFAFNATTGEVLWNVHVTDGNFECPITYFDHKIYIGEGLKGGVTTKYYYCYDDNGTEVWKHATDNTAGFLWCGASVVGDYIVFPTYEGKLISLYKENGTLTDEVDLTSELSFSRHDLGKIRASVTYHDGYVYTTSEKGQPVGYVWKVGFDINDGTFVDDGWSTANGFSTSTPIIYDGKVYVGQGEHGFTGNLTCLNDSNGEIIWSYFVDAGVKSSPAVSIRGGKPYVYFTTAKSDGSLYCLNSGGTLAWEYNPPDDGYVLQGAAISVGSVYFGTGGGYVYCLNKSAKIPDMIPNSLTPTTLYVNQSNEITVAVKNEGGSAGSFNVSLKYDGTLIGVNTINSLGASKEKRTGFTWMPTSTGTFNLSVTVDPENIIEESNETNNVMSVNVTVEIPMPDLVPTLLTPPPMIYRNHTNTIRATIRNNGFEDAPAFNVSLSANETVVDTVCISGLTGDSSTTVSFTWTPYELGCYELCVLADCDDEVEESNETNNERCENVCVDEGNPDLTVSKVALKTMGYVNKENILGVTVANIGAKNAGAFNVTLEMDGTQLGEQNIPSLDAWTSTELEFAWAPTDIGRHELTATADSNDEIEESDETNNNLTRTSVIIKRTDWAQFHYDDAHIGFSSSTAPNTNETLWISEDIGAVPSSSTVVAEGKVFVNCGDSLTALNEYTGEVLWSSPAEVGGAGGSWSSPAYHDGRAFINGEGAYSAADGSKIWDGLPGNTNGGPLVANGRVFIGDWGGHHYYCFDEETGEELWNFTVSGYAQGTPAFADGKVYFTSWVYVGGHVYCVDVNSRTQIWHQIVSLDACGSPTVSNGIVYVTTYNFEGDGDIHALNATNGSILWQKTIQRTDSTPAVAYGNVYVTGGCAGYSDIQTYCFNATTGELIWETNVSDGIGGWTQSVAVADGKVLVGKPEAGTGMSFDYAGTYALDAFTGDIIWSHPEGGSSPAVADGMVFTIGDGKVYAFGGAPSIPPDITSWNPVEAIVNDTEGATRTFNITANQTVNVSWQINGTEVFNQTDVTGSEYRNTSAVVGVWNVSAIASNENGTAIQTWLWIVHPQDTNPPGSIINLTNTTGNFWINWTWTNPAGADFNHTMVYLNSTWKTNTSNEYFNLTNLSSHASKTISTRTVDTSENVNETWVNQTTTIPNNEPVLEAIGDKNMDEEETLTIDANASDLDDDTLRYFCNRTDLFSDFNTTTGVGSWTPASRQAGTYCVDFGVADGFSGGIDNETIKITVYDRTPPASISNLSYTNGTTWINWTWTNPADADFNYTKVYLNGTWKTNTSYPFYNATALDPDTCYEIGTHTVDTSGNINKTWVNQTAKTEAEILEKLVFDTGEGTYPSIFGTHKGKIVPDKDIIVNKMYTYPCTGTGGHAEYVKIWNKSGWNVSASWKGYKGDWHNISFSESFTLKGGKTYYYEIKTGSYPQIIHEKEFNATGGIIICTKFVDANGKIYNGWIPAISLYF